MTNTVEKTTQTENAAEVQHSEKLSQEKYNNIYKN